MACCLIAACHLYAQKYDYNFINRATPHGSGVTVTYSDSLQDIGLDIFQWEGTVDGCATLSNKEGKTLGYFNARNLYDSIGRIAINGDSMAVGFYLNYIFQFFEAHRGMGPGNNANFIHIHDSLVYLFYKSSEYWADAPGFAIDFTEKGKRLTSYSEGLYLTKIRLSPDGRLYVLPHEKHILLDDGLFQICDLVFCKHANGDDWWLIVPKALNNQALRLRIYKNGEIEYYDDILFSDNYWRVRSGTEFVFSPEGDHMVRLIVRPNSLFDHLLEIYSFDRCLGTLQLLKLDSIPLPEVYTYMADVEFSANGRFLYVAIGSVILQMDMEDPDFIANRDTIAEWDGVKYYFLYPLMDQLWRLPNGKILVASMEYTPFLHYIHEPDKPGAECRFEQRALMLPVDPLNEPYGVAMRSLPDFPPFRMKALDTPCVTHTDENNTGGQHNAAPPVLVYPNPSIGNEVTIAHAASMHITLSHIDGRVVYTSFVPDGAGRYQPTLPPDLPPGIYLFTFSDKSKSIQAVKKWVRM